MNGRSLPDLGRRGEGWFAVQVALFVAIAFAGGSGPAWGGPVAVATGVIGAALIGAGGLLAFRGLVDLRENLTPFPRPMPGAELVQTGAYSLVRHPIYGGLVLGTSGVGTRHGLAAGSGRSGGTGRVLQPEIAPRGGLAGRAVCRIRLVQGAHAADDPLDLLIAYSSLYVCRRPILPVHSAAPARCRQ